MAEKTRDEIEVELRGAYEYLEERRQEIAELTDKLTETEERLEEETRRCRAITAGYSGMRKKLDMGFGSPDDANGYDRTAKGRTAGLQGAVDYAVAEYARVMREAAEK
jgi:hypothetical protein